MTPQRVCSMEDFSYKNFSWWKLSHKMNLCWTATHQCIWLSRWRFCVFFKYDFCCYLSFSQSPKCAHCIVAGLVILIIHFSHKWLIHNAFVTETITCDLFVSVRTFSTRLFNLQSVAHIVRYGIVFAYLCH